ncbi:Ig-like domain-containing protein [Candidatus Palauibacter sp.]|uniref:Ig-like domain-containing protein n=1 Tax=Candidatus Palauibacter sp. TaxID=3101350 RepID=UPI003B52E1CA
MIARTACRTRGGAGAAVLAALAVATACERDLTSLDPATFPPEAEIFYDDFGPGLQYSAFGGSKVDALDIERDEVYRGTTALKFSVPAPSDPSGGFAGGAFFSEVPRDLSGFDALTFWARASTAATLDRIGIGNDNTGTSRFPANLDNLPLSTRWTKYALPLPLPSVLTGERGLFLVADASEYEVGYDVYFDDVQFERLGTIINPRPVIPSRTVSGEVGGTLTVDGTRVIFDVNGTDVTVSAAPSYFTFMSSDPAVASVLPDGSISLVRAGNATITARLGSTAASGALTVSIDSPPSHVPSVPTVRAEDVISLFSDAYDDVPVDTWSAEWDQADVEDVVLAGNPVKKYSNLAFAGIEFTSSPIDATSMTHFHVDLWTNDASDFRIKLVDFGADGMFGGGDDREHEITLGPTSTPSIAPRRWNALDISLDAFSGLSTRSHLAQLIISGASPTVYLDNIFFFRTETPETPDPTGPTEPAPAPMDAAADVISLFSDAYTDVAVDTWSAEWDAADLEDVSIAGNAVKKYTNLVFAGIEFASQTVDASGMSHLRLDIWTPNETAGAAFRVKLVDFGANGVYDESGDDSEHEITIRAADGLATGEWVRLDLPLADFTGLAARGHLAQLILSGDLNTLYVDNAYFRRPAAKAARLRPTRSINGNPIGDNP